MRQASRGLAAATTWLWLLGCGAPSGPVGVGGATMDDPDFDRIVSGRDHCPREAEDEDGFADRDGCPDRDDDRDGLPDVDDRCGREPEDRDGHQDDDGCPDPDNDDDRIADVQDRCPNEPERYNGREDEDGCPDEGTVAVNVDYIHIADVIWFARGAARPSAATNVLLDALAEVIRANPSVTAIAVLGQATAAERRPELLAQARADAIVAALVLRGVPAERLEARGLGTRAPPPDAPEPADALPGPPEPRVVFRILRIDGREVHRWTSDGALVRVTE